MNDLLQLAIYLLIGALVVYVVFFIVGRLNFPPDVKNIILIVISVIVLIWLLATFVPGLLS